MSLYGRPSRQRHTNTSYRLQRSSAETKRSEIKDDTVLHQKIQNKNVNSSQRCEILTAIKYLDSLVYIFAKVQFCY